MTETREQLLKKAYRLRDLGRYPEAHSLFGRAKEQADDLMLAVNIASTYMEQGYTKKCLAEINIGIEKFGNSTSDEIVVALAKILQASATSATTLRFQDPMKVGAEVFNRHLRELPVENYDGKRIALLLAYYYMRGLAGLCGFDVSTAPVPSSTEIEWLYYYLAGSGRFGDAFRIAKLYVAAAGPQLQAKLLDEFLTLEGPPELHQAEALGELANLLHGAGRQEDAVPKLETAMELYRKNEHATGPLFLEVQRFTMQPFGDEAARQFRRSTLFRLKGELESLEEYDGMRQAIKALYQLALTEQDDPLRVELDSEMQRLSIIRGCPMDWIDQQVTMIGNWRRVGPSTAQMLLSLEALYEEMETMEAPTVRSGIARTLAAKYQELGNIAKAEQWMDTANTEQDTDPRYWGFLTGKDAFYRVLEESTTAPEDEEDEIQALRRELLQVIEDVQPETTPPGILYLGIMKVTNMCELYIDKFVFYKVRGFDRTKRVVEACLEFCDALIQILPSSQTKSWEGTVMNVKAKLLSVQAVSCGDPNPQVISDVINSEVLCSAIESYDKAASLFLEAGLGLKNAQVQQQVAGCYKQMWILDNYSPTSKYFAGAVDKYEAAGKVLKMQGSIEQQRLNVFTLLSHWYSGHERRVTYRKGAYDETIACLAEAEQIIDQERQELSALSHHEAILAKQNMRKNKYIDSVFETAIKLFGGSEDWKSLWEWIQRSKARSVSDLLNLGINLPTDLKERIDADPVTKELLEKEAALAKEVKSAAPAAQFFARKALETHQQDMRKHFLLREVLELREGKSTTWKELQQMHTSSAIEPKRTTWFVDWFTIEGGIGLIAVSNETEKYHIFAVDMTIEDVSMWIKKNLDPEDKLNETLNEESSLKSLAELCKLVDPVIKTLSKENDLLVLCMTGILHRLPVHAAIIEGDADDPTECRTLIERNPIIYTSSMTIFRQCTTRSSTQPKNLAIDQGGPHTRGTVLGVYEGSDGDTGSRWQNERKQTYEMCSDLATQMQWGDAVCGVDVGKQRFQAACESDIVHFSGHFSCGSPNVLEQGIILAPLANSDRDSSVHGPHPKNIFSVTDVFSSKVKTSHFSIIACGSSTQAIRQGDEPLGFVTALLYAGAKSVTGTLWPIESGVGRAFTQSFYRGFQSREGDANDLDLAIALQEAIRSMRKNSNFEQPYYWAGFVLHGTWCYSRGS